MNHLVKPLMQQLVDSHGLVGLKDHEAFERLAAWCVLARQIENGGQLDDVMAGDETVGVDAIAVVANEALILDAQDAEDVCQPGRTVDVDFYFIQAKTSEKFERPEILNFGDAVADFFAPTPGLPESPFVAERRAAKDALYGHSPLFKNRRPRVFLSFVTTGKVNPADASMNAAVESTTQRLLDTSLFESVEVRLLGAAEVHKEFSSIEHREEATFNFGRKTAIPKIAGVQESYIGIVEISEFLKIICDKEENLKASIFYDNVRDFQDLNDVNRDILATLSDPSKAALLPVLNNGVTIVAQSIQLVGEEVTIEDYQVVNGCQTSHVIFHARDQIDGNVLVPLRLVVTAEDPVASAITKATNRQTPVEELSLQALTDFQKELESFFSGHLAKRRLYYERRSRQYAGQGVEQTRVITPLVQIRAFAAMFLDEPQAASRYYRKLYERVPADIFNAKHRHEPYYTAALAWYRLDVLFRRRLIDATLRPVRYHLLTGFKYLADPGTWPQNLEAKSVAKHCEVLNTTLMDEAEAVKIFHGVGDMILELNGGVPSRDTAKRERFTRELVTTLRRQAPTSTPPAAGA